MRWGETGREGTEEGVKGGKRQKKGKSLYILYNIFLCSMKPRLSYPKERESIGKMQEETRSQFYEALSSGL